MSNIKYTYEEVKEQLLKRGYILDINKEYYKSAMSMRLEAHDNDGYKYMINYHNFMYGNGVNFVSKHNPFSIYNINIFLKKYNIPFTCISEKYTGQKELLDYRCDRCGEIVKCKWTNINRKDRLENPSYHIIVCTKCDGRIESLHASVLKQMFTHIYPETVLEDKSCINPYTNYIMPTDIVNHELCIAIEIQSQWHDFEDKKYKDNIKKNFWINKGYKFYDPDIRDYTILELCQLFFNIDKLPNYINYNQSKKMDIKQVQELLDQDIPVSKISEITGYGKRRIYVAISDKRLSFSKDHIRGDYTPIDQYDINNNFIQSFDSIASVGKVYDNINTKSLASALSSGKNTFAGFNWYYR